MFLLTLSCYLIIIVIAFMYKQDIEAVVRFYCGIFHNNAEEPKATIRAIWALITPEQCHRLIPMPRLIAVVIQATGAPTKY